jgi:cytochrome c
MTSRFLSRVAAALLLLFLGTVVRADDAGDPVMGKRLFAQCGSCHAVEANGAEKIGPSLHGLFGRKAGAVPAFAYSQAMRESGIVWDAHQLGAFIKQPSVFLPGTRMAFLGVAKDQARADIIAYLQEATK